MTIGDAKERIDLLFQIPQVMTPYTHGKPGMGKSDILRQLAITRGISFIDLRLSQLESSDIRGIPTPDFKTGSSRWLPPETIPFEAFADLDVPGNPGKKFKDGGVLALDEFNRARFDVIQSGFQLVLDRRVGLHRILDSWFVAAAGNLGEADQTEITEITDKALLNRFAHFYIDDNGMFDCWLLWAEGEGKIHPDVLGFLKTKPSSLYIDPKEDEVIFPTPRSWDKFSQILRQNPKMESHRIAHLLGPHILGAGATINFLDFLKIRTRIRPDELLLHYEKYEKEIKKLQRDQKYSLSTEMVAYIKDKAGTSFMFKPNVMDNFHKFTMEDLDRDHMVAVFKGLAFTNIKNPKGQEVEFLDPYLDSHPEMNDQIANILIEAKDGKK